MKEELIRVLNAKLDDINVNIESLVELNKKIENEKNELSYTNNILNLFKEDNKYNVFNFTKLSKEDFDRVTSLVGEDVKNMFSTTGCNYDGLVYLINGINSGVSLSLTLEQENAINYLIQGVEGKCEGHEAVIDGLLLVKGKFPIDDVNVLEEKRNEYERVIANFKEEKYVSETDIIEEAIKYSNVENNEVIEMLTYLLKYNADIYNTNKDKISFENKENDFDIPPYVNVNEESIKPEIEFENNDIKLENNEVELNNYEDFHLPEFSTIDNPKEVTNYETPLVTLEENNDENEYEEPEENNSYEEYSVPEENISITPVQIEEEQKVTNSSTRELQRVFKEYDVNIDDNKLNDFVSADADNIKSILEVLKNNQVLGEFEKKYDLFRNVMLSSNGKEIENVLNIIKSDLCAEDEFNEILNTTIETIPSIFIRENGNYENFVRNTKIFKDLGINLINLFNFSKEVLIANHDNLVKNYNIVQKYGIPVDDKNAKYMLLLPNIAEKIDYYVESLYKDQTKGNEVFDGLNLIKKYPNKLNVVTDETIKRLRYSSENNKKVFGNKPLSLAGEITNLKVHVLDISNEYLDKFFNNNFDELTKDEVREYTKLCRNSSNIGNYTDELANLEEYHNNLRYTINGINISYNKVIRNYNTLRSYGIDKTKALMFAMCYNLVITKEEYENLKKFIEERDGE